MMDDKFIAALIRVLESIPPHIWFFASLMCITLITAATINLSRYMRERTPGVWSRLFARFRPQDVQRYMAAPIAPMSSPEQDTLLGKIIIADLREHLRSWGSLCAQLLQMVHAAKQVHPELFYCINQAQDQLALVGQKIANCYEDNSSDFSDVIRQISDIRNEFGIAVQAYQDSRDQYVEALQKAHARSDGAAKEALNNLKNFSH